MRRSAGHYFLHLLGSLCATAGFVAWTVMAWKALSDLDAVTPQGDVGGSLMLWALTGTVLVIVGMVILHIAVNASEREERIDGKPLS